MVATKGEWMSVPQLYTQLDGEEVLDVSELQINGKGAKIVPYPDVCDILVFDNISLAINEYGWNGLLLAIRILFPDQPHIYSKVESEYHSWIECNSESDSDSSWESLD